MSQRGYFACDYHHSKQWLCCLFMVHGLAAESWPHFASQWDAGFHMGNGNVFTGFRSHGLLSRHPHRMQTAPEVTSVFPPRLYSACCRGQFETLTRGFLEEPYGKAYFGRYVTEMEGWVSKKANKKQNCENETLKVRKAELCFFFTYQCGFFFAIIVQQVTSRVMWTEKIQIETMDYDYYY